MLIKGADGRDYFDPCHGRLQAITATGRRLDALLSTIPPEKREVYLVEALAEFDCPDEAEALALRIIELKLRQSHGLPEPT
ncbi:MAG: hypothetical protein NVV60_05775 [Luteimonas sp.]|nr:hypothetical protein [Luteimonas sp.]